MKQHEYIPRYGELLPNKNLNIPVSTEEEDVYTPVEVGPDHPMYSIWRRLIDPTQEDADLFDGQGHGSLHFIVGRNRDLCMDFHPENWEALFMQSLGCPPFEPSPKKESLEAEFKRRRRHFQQALPQYPLLSRIVEMYRDTIYKPEEVSALREECERAKAQIQLGAGIFALRKLIFACDDAFRESKQLWLLSD